MIRIQKEFINRLKDQIPLSEIINQYVHLTPRGDEFVGLCPFHKEKTPSFYVINRKQLYYCFGCHESGDAITFLIKIGGETYQNAVKKLANLAGIPLPSPQSNPLYKKTDTTLKRLTIVNQWYIHWLWNNSTVQNYLYKRHITQDMIHTFSLGYAPSKYIFMEKALKENISTLTLEELSLSKEGWLYFQERLTFPIDNTSGQIVGFGGRTLQQNIPAKYLNSPDSNLFKKGHLLYNASRIKYQTRIPLYIVEGYFDVIRLHSVGLRAVAPLGTALTKEQINLAYRYASHIIICFDGDTAGYRATQKTITKILPTLHTEVTVSFLQLPEGFDPDGYIVQYGKEKFLQQSLWSLIDMLYEIHSSKSHNPNEKALAEKNMITLLHTIQDPVLKKYYIQSLYQRLRQKNPTHTLYKQSASLEQQKYAAVVLALINWPNLLTIYNPLQLFPHPPIQYEPIVNALALYKATNQPLHTKGVQQYLQNNSIGFPMNPAEIQTLYNLVPEISPNGSEETTKEFLQSLL